MAALEALTFFVLPMLLVKKILTFHGVLLEHQGQGILVCAPSGVGKTTHARLWREHKNALILNGDRSPCYQKDGTWVAFGTPWCGTSGENVNRQVPVKALVLLRRGQQDQIVPMTAMEILTQVLELAICPAWPGFRERVLELLDGFLHAKKVRPLSLFYIYGHSYSFHDDNNWDLIERICAYAGGDPDTWYATNIEIYNYLTALWQLRFNVERTVVYNPTALDLWIEADRKPYKIPAGATVRL
jgi:hypothetical protein